MFTLAINFVVIYLVIFAMLENKNLFILPTKNIKWMIILNNVLFFVQKID